MRIHWPDHRPQPTLPGQYHSVLAAQAKLDQARRDRAWLALMRGGDGGERLTGLKPLAQARILVRAPRHAVPVWRAGRLIADDAVLPLGRAFRSALPRLGRGLRDGLL